MDYAVARLNADGTPDTSFGAGGRATLDLGGIDGASAVAIQPDGRIVLAGFSQSSFSVIRLEATSPVVVPPVVQPPVVAPPVGQPQPEPPADRTPPRLIAAYLTPAGKGHPRAGLSLVFSEPIDPATVRAANFRVAARRLDRRGRVVARPVRVEAVSYDPVTRTVTIRPDRRAHLPRGARVAVLPAVADPAGNALDGEMTGVAGRKAVAIVR